MSNISAPDVRNASDAALRPRAAEAAPRRHPLVRFVTSPPVRLFVGLSVVASALVEIVTDLDEFADLWRNVGAEHGLLLIGVVQFLQAVGDLLDGLDETVEARQD